MLLLIVVVMSAMTYTLLSIRCCGNVGGKCFDALTNLRYKETSKIIFKNAHSVGVMVGSACTLQLCALLRHKKKDI